MEVPWTPSENGRGSHTASLRGISIAAASLPEVQKKAGMEFPSLLRPPVPRGVQVQFCHISAGMLGHKKASNPKPGESLHCCLCCRGQVPETQPQQRPELWGAPRKLL